MANLSTPNIKELIKNIIKCLHFELVLKYEDLETPEPLIEFKIVDRGRIISRTTVVVMTNEHEAHINTLDTDDLYTGKGYGLLILLYTINFIFNEYDIQKISLDDMSKLAGTNTSIYQKVGFVQQVLNETTPRLRPKGKKFINNTPELVIYKEDESFRQTGPVTRSTYPQLIPGWNSVIKNNYNLVKTKFKYCFANSANQKNNNNSKYANARAPPRSSKQKSSKSRSKSRSARHVK